MTEEAGEPTARPTNVPIDSSDTAAPDTATPGGATPPPTGPPPPWAGGPAGNPPPADGGFAARYGLVRPNEGRHLAGVCAAIARATNTDPILWRVILAVLSFFGGIGILIYLAGWLLIPGEGDTASPVESMLGRGRSSMSPTLAIILSVLTVLTFGLVMTDNLRAILLGTAIAIGAALLINRNAGTGPVNGPATTTGTPAGAPGAMPPKMPPTWATHTPSHPPTGTGYPTTGPVWTSSPPASAPTEPLPSWPTPPPAGSPPPGAYRPAFAPHGPYARPGAYPPPAAPPPPKPPRERSPLGAATFSMVFLVIGVVAILDLTNILDIGVPAYFASVLVTIALGLLVGAWFGRARWLIALGLVASIGLGISTATEARLDSFNGQSVNWRPASYDLLADRYQLSAGEATLDLTAVDFTNRDAEIAVAVNLGELTVIVPPNVDVTVTATINAGDAKVFDHRWSGIGIASREVIDLGADGPGGGELRLDLQVNAGNIEVKR